jgi:hypothetical protein
MIGPSIPVLLTSGDQDTTDPPSSADADFAYYKAHCGCDVTQVILPDTAHLFMVHRSLASWADYVVNWLASHGIKGTPLQVPARTRRPRRRSDAHWAPVRTARSARRR